MGFTDFFALDTLISHGKGCFTGMYIFAFVEYEEIPEPEFLHFGPIHILIRRD